MNYYVSSGMLNFTHSLSHSYKYQNHGYISYNKW